MNRPEPPGGASPPAEAFHSDGTAIDLRAIAARICDLYRDEFPDEEQRYGGAGVKWCLHDNQYILAWAIQDARDGTVLLDEQAQWLSSVLESRGFPVERLVRDLQIAAEVALQSDELGALGVATNRTLTLAATGLSEAGEGKPTS